jgi:hypothetical protein
VTDNVCIEVSARDPEAGFNWTHVTAYSTENFISVMKQAEENAKNRGYGCVEDYLWDCIVHFSDCELAEQGDRDN